MDLGLIISKILQFPVEVQAFLSKNLKLAAPSQTPAGAIFMGMELLSRLGIPQLLDRFMEETHRLRPCKFSAILHKPSLNGP